MLSKEIKKPLTVGLILYGIAVLISLLCVLFPNAVFDFLNGHAVDLCSDSLIFPLVFVFHIAVFLLFAVFTIIMHKYKGSSERLIVILFIRIYCVINVAKPFVLNFETYMVGELFAGEKDLAHSFALSNSIEMITFPFTVVSSVLVFIAVSRYGIRRYILELTADSKIPDKVKIPMIVSVLLYSQALMGDILCVLWQQSFYKHQNAPIGNIFVFPTELVFQIIFMIMFSAFLIVMLKRKGISGRKTGIVMTVIYCVMIFAEPFVRYSVSTCTLSTLGVKYIEATTVLEKYITLYTSPFTTVSAVFLFIAVGRYGMIKHENNAEMLE
ncbi:MAG: hypothetical protein K6B74_02090 [Ruminococcus sp.]|nr:hypothetical protein [Ruminococcus sp.]